MKRTKILMLMIAMFALFAAPVAAAEAKPKAKPAAVKPINITGTWEVQGMGLRLLLHQEKDVVWGKHEYGALVRGTWSEGRLIMFFRSEDGGYTGPGSICNRAPFMFVMKSKGTATQMDGVQFTPTSEIYPVVFRRESPNAGPDFEYPYGAELKDCGSLPTHEFAFDVNSDKLKGSDWPLLKAVAETLKKEAGLKIRILGHTDSTGDAAKNKDLSQRRAESVKKVLAQKYGADEKRISTKGWGDEQPLVSNETEEGRAINRRVEITVER